MAETNYDQRADVTDTQETAVSKIKESLDNLAPEKKEQILTDFDEFKDFLGSKLKLAESIGFSEEQIAILAEKAANYLSAHEEPRNSEEKLLQELWRSGTKEEQHMLARMLVRLTRG
jgi:organic radical activating enzyme